MSDRQARLVIRSMVLVGVASTLIGSAAIIGARGWDGFAAHNAPLAIVWSGSIGLIAWLASRQSHNALVWVLAVSSLGFYTLGEAARLVLDPAGPLNITVDSIAPADMPPRAALVASITLATATSISLLFNVFALLLFPNGRLPSPRWRPVALTVVAAALWSFVVNLIVWDPASTVVPEDHRFWGFSTTFNLIGIPLGLLSLLIRFRSAPGTERAQIKLLLWAGCLFVPALLAGSVLGVPLFIVGGSVALFGAYGVAIVRHNLFDVNLVISRTLAYATLAALIGLVYVAVVVGVGSLLGSGDEPNPVLAIAATAVVAVVFQPARRRLQQVANRLVYGRRATPYQVLSEFSRRVAATSETLLDDAARSLVDATGARGVAVNVAVDGRPVIAAAWPADAAEHPAEIEPVHVPITDGGTRLGSLDVHLPPGESLTDDERRLVEQLASGMGLALSNEVLTERLAARVDELRQSRRRLVAVQDDTRRRLERDLHDGAQQQLVALKVKLGLCRSLIERSGDAEMLELLERLSVDADDAVECLRDFARGVFPPLLETEGLEAAIGAQVRRSGLPIEVDAPGIGRYPREIESTVYFCVLEALADLAGRAGANHARVQLSQQNGSLRFEIHDDGTAAVDSSSRPGLRRIGVRLEALSGGLEYRHEPGNGTTVIGSLPATATAVMS